MSRIDSLFNKKSHLFTIVTVAIIGIIGVPIILPHLVHTHYVLHIILHIGELILAVFVAILSVIAYFRMKTRRFLLTMAAFLSFIASASVSLVESVWSFYFYLGELSLLEIGHIFLFTTIGLLALGAFRND